ncbi:glycoside hydrolase family 3 N-terminal domain-containing protein [Rapidithrix thailandica]|uniref:beta-N-acetylhexosaminidase n=1 Tax=Rapidithrix thailandica TaxID=413964 RepID=A0AAW9S2N2_9BACT
MSREENCTVEQSPGYPMMKAAFLLMLMSLLLACSKGEATDTEKKSSEKTKASQKQHDAYLKKQEAWVDSIYLTMSLDEKIGQLFMVPVYSNKNEQYNSSMEKLIEKYHVGGVIFMQGGPARQAILGNRLQEIAKIPLLVAMDAEWGLGMRLDSVISFPKQMTLGAISDDRYVYDMGREVARQLKRVGAHMNFAPVIDVNNNPNNPVIGYRSFGENKENVARKGIAYMKGMQHHGVIANAKHFPGHGDTDTDSHHALPVINHSYNRLDDIEMYPFRQLIADSLMSVMVGHLHIPALDSAENVATSLSKAVVTDLLREKLHFNGLIVTDGLGMKGVAKYRSSAEVDLMALLAGNDMLLMSNSVSEGFKLIKDAIVKDSTFTEETLERSIKRILAAKYFVGLNTYKPVETQHVYEDVNHPAGVAVKSKLYEQAITVVKNKKMLIPFFKVDSLDYASVAIGTSKQNTFQEYLSKYAPFEHHRVANKAASAAEFDQVYKKVKDKGIVVVSFHGMNNRKKYHYGISNNAVRFIQKLQKETKVVVVAFGNPYSLQYLESSEYLVCAYENDPLMQKVVPQVLFGAVTSHGKLPVTASPGLPVGTGFKITSLGRMGYEIPEGVGLSSFILGRIDSLAEAAIADEATPGCQIVVAKSGKIVYEKAFGYYTYEKKQPVTFESIYDVASVTKVASTLQALMYLDGKRQFNLEETLKEFLPEADSTNKGDMLMRDLLTHQAGLKSFIPFWNHVRNKQGLKPEFISQTRSDSFNLEISPGLYAVNSINDSIWHWTLESSLTRRKKNSYGMYRYWYSDVAFYIMQNIVERVTGWPLDELVREKFYKPLGLKTTTYMPLKQFSLERIVPTEMDTELRHSLIQGYVHDPGAALKGGVGGHAGLFSNAHDLAILMQMNLQEGYYGGEFYLLPSVLAKYNTQPYKRYDNRRAIGWDKPSLGEGGLTSDYSTDATFGHTGFTGTCVWVDPEYELVYVFLSNRVYPFVGNQKLNRNRVRQSIHNTVYESMFIHEQWALNRLKQ